MSAIADVEIESAGALHADRQEVRRELLRELVRSPAFLVGAFILLVWIVCAIFGSAIAPHSPYAQNLLGVTRRRQARTRLVPTSSGATCCRA